MQSTFESQHSENKFESSPSEKQLMAPKRLSKLQQFQSGSRQLVNETSHIPAAKNAYSVLTARKSEGILVSSRNRKEKKSNSTLKQVSFNFEPSLAQSARVIEGAKFALDKSSETKHELSRVIEKNCEMLNSSQSSQPE